MKIAPQPNLHTSTITHLHAQYHTVNTNRRVDFIYTSCLYFKENFVSIRIVRCVCNTHSFKAWLSPKWCNLYSLVADRQVSIWSQRLLHWGAGSVHTFPHIGTEGRMNVKLHASWGTHRSPASSKLLCPCSVISFLLAASTQISPQERDWYLCGVVQPINAC